LNHSGLTAMEVLFTMIILSIIVAISFGGYQTYTRHSNLSSNVYELVGMLERAHNLSVVSFNGKQYGVHFETGQYVLFPGPAYQTGAQGNEVRTLTGFRFANASVFDNGAGGFTQNVLFQALHGQTVNVGTIRIESVADSSVTNLITVNEVGVITIQ